MDSALVGVENAALTEGVKFLFTEAGELIKRWLDRKGKPGADREIALDVHLPEAFVGELHPVEVAPGTFEKNESAIASAYGSLSFYANGIKPIDVSDRELLEIVAELRDVFERLFGQTLTFKGEQRPPSGTPVVRGRIDVKTLSGEGAGVRTKTVLAGTIDGAAKVEIVDKNARVYGVIIDDELGT